eukprot:NODE_3560_length_769_cov_273.539216.p2 GENE.NODE_3560_length_769_cov_273.539216~~NODE_3560_length_769_cov_273.539216.p2  ORF type:complete len:238 (-),score=62.70 NODE_3560_length_769_cov_273.539216:40-672(-)
MVAGCLAPRAAPLPRPMRLLALAVTLRLAAGGIVREFGEKELGSKWFARQDYALVEFHGMVAQVIHKNFVPIYEEAAEAMLEAGMKVTTARADLRHWPNLKKTFNLDEGKFPALFLFRRGKVIRRWAPVMSYIQRSEMVPGDDFGRGEMKDATPESIVEWLEDHMEKTEKAERKAEKAAEKAAKKPALFSHAAAGPVFRTYGCRKSPQCV